MCSSVDLDGCGVCGGLVRQCLRDSVIASGLFVLYTCPGLIIFFVSYFGACFVYPVWCLFCVTL